MPAEGPPVVLLLSVFAVAAVTILTGLSVLSRLVRIERERHPDAWEADGRPAAPWIVPWRIPSPGDPSVPRSPRELWRTNGLALRWVVSTPEWARGDAEARRLLWGHRVLHAIALVCVGTWFALTIPHLGRR